MMSVTILGFGIIREIFNKDSISIEVPEKLTVINLKIELEKMYPALKDLASYMFAINNSYANGSEIINANDEIAIIPPVSGG